MNKRFLKSINNNIILLEVRNFHCPSLLKINLKNCKILLNLYITQHNFNKFLLKYNVLLYEIIIFY